jgi:hypothetical protein
MPTSLNTSTLLLYMIDIQKEYRKSIRAAPWKNVHSILRLKWTKNRGAFWS